MVIKIIEEPDIYIAQAEAEQLRREWEASQRYTTAPCSFETWVRSRKAIKLKDTAHAE